MSPTDFRAEMEARWTQFSEAAERAKDSNAATFALYDWYRTLVAEQRLLADDVFSDWVHSADERQQFDALAAIHEYGIRSALPSLRQLSEKLALDDHVDTRFRLLKVKRLIASLEGDAASMVWPAHLTTADLATGQDQPASTPSRTTASDDPPWLWYAIGIGLAISVALFVVAVAGGALGPAAEFMLAPGFAIPNAVWGAVHDPLQVLLAFVLTVAFYSIVSFSSITLCRRIWPGR